MRKLGFLALIPVSAGVIGLTMGALWLAGSSSGQRERFSSLQIAPADAAFYMAINTDPTSPQWLAVNDSLDAINAKDPLRKAVDDALAEFDLEWERDIVPVAGDEAFIAVPDIQNIEGGRGFIAGVRTQDAGKAQDLLDRVRERAEREGEEFKEEEYEGVTIVYVAAPPDLDGNPATSSDCEVDASNSLLCDGWAPIPEDPDLKCIETYIELTGDGNLTDEFRAACRSFFECPLNAVPEIESDPTDLDGNGSPDSCDEVERAKQEREKSIELAAPYQDCADLEDISDYQCQDVPPVVIAQAAGVGGAVAVVNDVLAVGGVPDDVKAVIDVVQGRAPSAAGNERLMELRQKQTEDFLAWGYADLAPVWDVAEASLPADSGAGDDSGSSQSTQPRGMPAPEAGYRVTSFDAEYTIETNGWLSVKETIGVDFGTQESQGILRDLTARISYDFTNDEIIRVGDIVMTRDDAPESYGGELIGDYFHVTTGDPNVMITGQHTYVLEYTTQGGIRQHAGAYHELRWVATGDRWTVPIENASVTVHTPNGTIDVANCHVGVGEFGADDYMSCTADFDNVTARFYADGPIEPGAGLHFSIGVNGESGAPPPYLVPTDESLLGESDSTTAGGPEELPFAFASEELLKELRGRLDRAGFSISSTSDGFAFDLTVLEAPGYEPEEPFGPIQGFEPELAELLPADTMFYLSAFDFYNQAGRQAGSGLGGEGNTTDDFLNGFRDETGIDLDRDLLSLLTGEIAFAGNVSNFDADTPDFELAAVADVSDEEKASGTLEKLGEYLENQDVIRTREEAGAWQWNFVDGFGAEPIGWAVRDGRLIVGYPDSAATEVGTQDSSLAESRDWKRTLELLPDEKMFVGFVSMARVIEEVRETQDAEAEFRRSTDGKLSLEDLEAIRSVGFSATTDEDGFSFHAVLFMENN